MEKEIEKEMERTRDANLFDQILAAVEEQGDTKERSEACTMGRHWKVPDLAGKDELFCLEISLNSTYTGKTKCGEEIGKTIADKYPPQPDFWIVGTDIEAIKREVCLKIDGLFQNIENDKAIFKSIREAGGIS